MSSAAPRILIVDDEETLLGSLSKAARESGYQTDTARDGAEAWQRLAGEGYDLVVTDLRMPGVDGQELLRRIQGAGLAVKVVVITGFATLEAAVDCLRKGAVDFLVKPFPVEEFLRSVARALGRRTPEGVTGPDWAAVSARFGLTRRQTEVLRALYTTGMTNRDLARHLCLSPHTVKSHLKQAFQKVGVATRAQLLHSLR
ncbi:MAG: response regulator [Deferrisomatales bacterium]|nr:response regulator [Deferrisomatales bacterium]